MFSSVDFPEPDGPVIDSHSPRRNTRSTSINASTAGSVPNCLHTLRRSRTRSTEAADRHLWPSPHGFIDRRRLGCFIAHHHELTGRESPIEGSTST